MPCHNISYENKKKLPKISYLSQVYNNALAEQIQYKEQRKRRRTVWSHEWLQQCDNDQSTVYSKIEEEDPEQFFNVFRMNKETFYKLLGRIEHIIERENTNTTMEILARGEMSAKENSDEIFGKLIASRLSKIISEKKKSQAYKELLALMESYISDDESI